MKAYQGELQRWQGMAADSIRKGQIPVAQPKEPSAPNNVLDVGFATTEEEKTQLANIEAMLLYVRGLITNNKVCLCQNCHKFVTARLNAHLCGNV